MTIIPVCSCALHNLSYTYYSEQQVTNFPCPLNHKRSTKFNASCPVDVDECASDNGGCQCDTALHDGHNCAAVCNNTFGSYECGCSEGYTLAADSITCVGKSSCTKRVIGKLISSYPKNCNKITMLSLFTTTS